MEEYFDIRDSAGNPTGEVKARSLVHRDGDIHGTSHVWLVRKNKKSGYDVLLQKRSDNKDSFPGCYDISAAGHVSCGGEYLPAALRELEEELGIRALPEQLQYVGLHRGSYQSTFYGKPFRDNELSAVYIYGEPVDASSLTLQESEVTSVRWMDLSECIQGVLNKTFPNCIYIDELRMVEKFLLDRHSARR